MESSHPTPDSEVISVESTEEGSPQRFWLAVASLTGTLSGLGLSVPAWIFANQANDIAREIYDDAYYLDKNTIFGTRDPGQVPTLAESYAHYQHASTISTICFLFGSVLILTGLALAIRIRQKRISDPGYLPWIALLNFVTLISEGILLAQMIRVWTAFLFWGINFF